MGQYMYRIRYPDGHVTPWADWNSTPKQELENRTATRVIRMNDPAPQAVGKAVRVDYELPLRPPGMVHA